MIPTMHLRYVMSFVGATPELQQLWVPLMGEETLFYPLPYLEANGGVWRRVPWVLH